MALVGGVGLRGVVDEGVVLGVVDEVAVVVVRLDEGVVAELDEAEVPGDDGGGGGLPPSPQADRVTTTAAAIPAQVRERMPASLGSAG